MAVNIDRFRNMEILIRSDPKSAMVELESPAWSESIWGRVQLARMYEKGLGVGPDRAKQEFYLKQAYNAGSHPALYRLGRLYISQNNYDAAEEIFQKGVLEDYLPAFYWLAITYEMSGREIEYRDQIFSLFEKAAARGHLYASRRLINILLTRKYGKRNIPRAILMNFKLIFKAIWLILFKGKDVRKA